MGTRRRVLRVLAAVVIAVTAVAGCGDDDDGSDTGSGQDLIDPSVIESENGVLEAQLTIEPAQITVGGKTFTSNVYTGDYVAPVLVVRRNDEVRLDLYNRIGRTDIQIEGAQSTNIHYHGFDISPKSPADDPFLHIDAAEGRNTFEYRWRVPSDHPARLTASPHHGAPGHRPSR